MLKFVLSSAVPTKQPCIYAAVAAAAVQVEVTSDERHHQGYWPNPRPSQQHIILGQSAKGAIICSNPQAQALVIAYIEWNKHNANYQNINTY